MANDTNIDEILKSIDALLKEGGPELDSDKDAGDQNSKRRRDMATNDDEVSDHGVPDAVESTQGGEVKVDEPALETIEPEPAEHQEIDDAVQDDQPADTPVMDAIAGQTLAQGHEVKRIVLSEAMLVEDTSDLPLAFAADDVPNEEVQAENIVADDGFADGPSSDDVGADALSEDEPDESGKTVSPALMPVADAEAQAGQAEAEYEAVADTSGLDMGKLIEQITAEISERLQQQLPGMVAGLVAEAMEKNLVAHAGPDDESIDDRQN